MNYNQIKFRNINISTITINIESNITFNLNEIINFFSTDFITQQKFSPGLIRSYELLKNQKEIEEKDFKKLKFEEGTISYINYKNNWRGLKKKKNKIGKRKNDFINQATIDIFVPNCFSEDNKRVNMMIFRNGKIKMAGCKNSNDAINALNYFWDIISNFNSCFSINMNMTFLNLEKSPYEFLNWDNHPSFIFTNEMINVSFCFPFILKKKEINRLFSTLKDNEFVCKSHYEPTGQQYVNIKIYSEDTIKKAILIQESIDVNKPIYDMFVIDTTFKHQPKTCFMIFDKRVIASGIDYLVMEKHYNFFINLIEKNYDKLKLNIQ